MRQDLSNILRTGSFVFRLSLEPTEIFAAEKRIADASDNQPRV